METILYILTFDFWLLFVIGIGSMFGAAEFSRVIIFTSCFGGFIWFYIQDLVRWDIAIPVTLGAIIGSHIGILLLPKLNMKWVCLILPLIFLILIAQVFIELFF